MIHRWAAFVFLAALAGCAASIEKSEAPSPPSPQATTPVRAPADATAIATAIAAPERSSSDRAEDAWRQPATLLNFLGIQPGMRVIDVFAAGGYYSELLARAVGDQGKVILYNNPPYARFAGNKPAQRVANGRLPNLEVITAEVPELALAPDSLDAAVFVMSYHDLYWRPKEGGWEQTDPGMMLRALHKALKPSGVIIVQDHAARAGAEVPFTADKLHRIDPERVKQDFANAGFRLDAEDNTFAHPEDDMSKLVFDPALRHKTHQFLFRFVKR